MRTFISVLTLGLLCTAAPSKPTTTLHHTTLVLEHASEGALRATQQRARELDGVVTIQLPSSTIYLAEPLRLTHRDSHTRWQGKSPFTELSGGLPVEGWVRVGERNGIPLWTAPLPKRATHRPEQLFARDGRRTRARTPNLGEYFIWKAPVCNLTAPSDPGCSERARYGFVYNNTDVLSVYANNDQVQFTMYHAWTVSRHHLREIQPWNNTVWFTNPSDRPIGTWSNHDSEGGGRYYVDNILEGLDAPGEWYCDYPGRLIFYLARRPEEDPNRMGFVVPQLQRVLLVDGAVDVELNGLRIAHSDWHCGQVQVCDYQSTAWTAVAAVEVVRSQQVRFDFVELVHHGFYAFWVHNGAHDITLQRAFIWDLGSGGVRIGSGHLDIPTGRATGGHLWSTHVHSSVGVTVNDAEVHNVTVADSVIAHGGFVFPSGTGVFVQANVRNVSIVHNDIAHFAGNGVSVGWDWHASVPSNSSGHTVAQNHIHHLGTTRELGDAFGCIYTLGQLNGTHLDNNLCHDVYAYNLGGFFVSHDSSSSNITTTNNVCFHTSSSSFYLSHGIGIEVRNNLFLEGGYNSSIPQNPAGFRTLPKTTTLNEFVLDLNVYYNTNRSAEMFDGDFEMKLSPLWNISFSRTLYWNSAFNDLANRTVFGGCTVNCWPHEHFTFAQWQSQGMDLDGAVADPLFADPHRYTTFNFTLLPESPALARGFTQIDVSHVGPRHATPTPKHRALEPSL